MTTSPFEPDPKAGTEHIAASDPGAGAPMPAPGFGARGEEHEQPGEEAERAAEAAEAAGRGPAGGQDAGVVDRYEFAFDGPYEVLLRLVGVRPDSCLVAIDEQRFYARFGPWVVSTPADNIADVTLSGPFHAIKAIGPRVSLADRGLTFGTNAERGLCIRFKDPVRGIEPTGWFRHPALTVTVEQPDLAVQRLWQRVEAAKSRRSQS